MAKAGKDNLAIMRMEALDMMSNIKHGKKIIINEDFYRYRYAMSINMFKRSGHTFFDDLTNVANFTRDHVITTTYPSTICLYFAMLYANR